MESHALSRHVRLVRKHRGTKVPHRIVFPAAQKFAEVPAGASKESVFWFANCFGAGNKAGFLFYFSGFYHTKRALALNILMRACKAGSASAVYK